VFELETMLKCLPSDSDAVIPLDADSARDIAAKFAIIRTALRRIVSLEEKNVAKYAKEIAADALRRSHS
jgi:hypothetical protein